MWDLNFTCCDPGVVAVYRDSQCLAEGSQALTSVRVKIEDSTPDTDQTNTKLCVFGQNEFKRTLKVVRALCTGALLVSPSCLSVVASRDTARPDEKALQFSVEKHSWKWLDAEGTVPARPVRGVRNMFEGTSIAVYRPFDPAQGTSTNAAPSVDQLRQLVQAGGGRFLHALWLCDELQNPGKFLNRPATGRVLSSLPIADNARSLGPPQRDFSDHVCVWIIPDHSRRRYHSSQNTGDDTVSSHRILNTFRKHGILTVTHSLFFDLVQLDAQRGAGTHGKRTVPFGHRVRDYLPISDEPPETLLKAGDLKTKLVPIVSPTATSPSAVVPRALALHREGVADSARRRLDFAQVPALRQSPTATPLVPDDGADADDESEEDEDEWVVQKLRCSSADDSETPVRPIRRSNTRSRPKTYSRKRPFCKSNVSSSGLAFSLSAVASKPELSDADAGAIAGSTAASKILAKPPGEKSDREPVMIERANSAGSGGANGSGLSDGCSSDSSLRLTPGQRLATAPSSSSSSQGSCNEARNVIDEAEKCPSKPAPSPPITTWTCPCCTFDNHLGRSEALSDKLTCEVCQFSGANTAEVLSLMQSQVVGSQGDGNGVNTHSIAESLPMRPPSRRGLMSPPLLPSTGPRRRRRGRRLNPNTLSAGSKAVLSDLVDAFALLGIRELGRRLRTDFGLSTAGDINAMAQRLVLHLVSLDQLSLDPADHTTDSGGFDAAIKALDLRTFFQHAKQVQKGSRVDAAASIAAAEQDEAERTRWPKVLRDYNVDDPQHRRHNIGFVLEDSETRPAGVDEAWSAAWRGRGRGRLLGEGGCKKVFKVYNCAQKRWEAALVLRQQRHLRRASLLRIHNELQNRLSSPDVPSSRPAGQRAHGSSSQDAKNPTSKATRKKASPVELPPRSSLLEYKTRVSVRRQAVATSTLEELAFPSPGSSDANISLPNITTPPTSRPLRKKHAPIIPPLRLGYDREILGLVKCSELATGMASCGPQEKASDTSPLSRCVVSSVGRAASAEGATATPFPHFLTVFAVATDILRPAITLWPNEDELQCTQMALDDSSDDHGASDELEGTDSCGSSSSDDDDGTMNGIHEEVSLADRVRHLIQRHNDRRRRRGLNTKRAETIIFTELCSGCDLEEMVAAEAAATQLIPRRAPSDNSSTSEICRMNFPRFQSILFQMVLAVYTGRVHLGMRHNDLKLSNFLVDPDAFRDDRARKQRKLSLSADSPIRGHGSRKRGCSRAHGSNSSSFVVRYVLGAGATVKFDVPLRVTPKNDGPQAPEKRHRSSIEASDSESDRGGGAAGPDDDIPATGAASSVATDTVDQIECIKLADFGNADLGMATVGMPVQEWHFSTLYLIPVEHIVLGSQSTQSFAADTWMLGMSVLHLLGGPDWWDELRSSVRCPPTLREMVLTTAKHHESQFSNSFLHPRWHGGGLLDTLYFYIIMRGWGAVQSEAPSSWSVPAMSSPGTADGNSCTVWSTIVEFASSVEGSKTLRHDSARFRLGLGSAPGFSRLHSHLQPSTSSSRSGSFSTVERRNTFDLICQMLCFDPRKRPPLFEVLCSHPIFASLRRPLDANSRAQVDAHVNVGIVDEIQAQQF